MITKLIKQIFMDNNQILKELNACTTVCNICFEACLNVLNAEEGIFMARCIELTRECAEVCQLASSMIARDSENIDKYLRLCAEIAETCANECKKHDYEFCEKCAQVCNTCASMCYAY
jgi:hypothetical protein